MGADDRLAAINAHQRRALRRLGLAIVFVVGALAGALLVVGLGPNSATAIVDGGTPSTTATTTRDVEFQRVRPCDDLAGFVVQDVNTIPTCLADDDTLVYSPSGSHQCADGLVIWWSDVAWGYLGRPAHLQPDDTDLAVPEQVWTMCVSPGPGRDGHG